jgi:hypothetical protein
MNGITEIPIVKVIRPEVKILDGGFFVNGTSNPVSTTHFGQLKGLMTITYSATGKFNIVFASGISFVGTPIFTFQVSMKAGDTAVDVKQLGAWNNTTRTVICQTVDYAGAAAAPAAADADRFVTFTINVVDSAAR